MPHGVAARRPHGNCDDREGIERSLQPSNETVTPPWGLAQENVNDGSELCFLQCLGWSRSSALDRDQLSLRALLVVETREWCGMAAIAARRTFMRALLAGAGAALTGCATTPSDLTADGRYCYHNARARSHVCTAQPVPSAAESVQDTYAPSATAFTLYVVRNHWGDRRRVIAVSVDGEPSVDTVPKSRIRFHLRAGGHVLSCLLDGTSFATSIRGDVNEIAFVGMNRVGWAWGDTFEWTHEPARTLRRRAANTRLVANVDLT